jgi:hypothetical protein
MYPLTGLGNVYGYPSVTSVSAFGYNQAGERGNDHDVLYSYAAVTASVTRDAASTSASPILGGMWKAIDTDGTLSVSDIRVAQGIKVTFEVL